MLARHWPETLIIHMWWAITTACHVDKQECIYIHGTYIHIYIHTYIHTYVHTYIHHACIHTYRSPLTRIWCRHSPHANGLAPFQPGKELHISALIHLQLTSSAFMAQNGYVLDKMNGIRCIASVISKTHFGVTSVAPP